jgi:hypothetical protein
MMLSTKHMTSLPDEATLTLARAENGCLANQIQLRDGTSSTISLYPHWRLIVNEQGAVAQTSPLWRIGTGLPCIVNKPSRLCSLSSDGAFVLRCQAGDSGNERLFPLRHETHE